MARPRWRLRTLLLAIAAVALALGAGLQADRMRRRSDLYLRRARGHSQAVVGIRFSAATRGRDGPVRFTSDEVSRIEYHNRLHERYDHAAAHPWEALPPDPPPPP